ncbi:MAG: DUF2202 domain-containing protein [bacterium]
MGIFRTLATVLGTTALATLLTACDPDRVGEWLAEGVDPGAPAQQAAAAEEDGLTLMREEEKLARDLYQVNFERYGTQVFGNITASEQRHMDAVLGLLQARGLDDPAAGQPRGVFTAAAVQDLYDALDAQSAGSVDDALRVGAEVEEIDILDLQRLMDETDAADLLDVYGSLLDGSYNHLRAFVRQLDRRGVVYQPRHLDAATFAAILADR